MTEQKQLMRQEPATVVARGQKMAAALSSYARALTFENRSRRNLYRLAGLAPRTRDRFFSVLLIVTIAMTFALPFTGSVIYYLFVASPGYTSEVRFIVRSSAPLLSRDRYSSETVEPKAKIVQDTAVLLNYLGSPAIIQDLGKHVTLSELYGRTGVDFISRLPVGATQEDVLRYWMKRHSTSVNPKSGIVELKVTAFTPREARDLVKLVLQLSEQQVNRLNSGMWNDLLVSTQRDVDIATNQVSDLRAKLRDTQNDTGVFDVELSAESIITVLTTIESSIADLRSRRLALTESIKEGSPQLSEIDRRLTGLEEQARTLREKAAGSSGTSGNLANFSSIFDKMKLDLKLAEEKLGSAIGELEKIKLVSSLQLVYVDNFTEPTLPETSTYPNVALSIFLSFLSFSAFGAFTCGAIIFARKKLD